MKTSRLAQVVTLAEEIRKLRKEFAEVGEMKVHNVTLHSANGQRSECDEFICGAVHRVFLETLNERIEGLIAHMKTTFGVEFDE